VVGSDLVVAHPSAPCRKAARHKNAHVNATLLQSQSTSEKNLPVLMTTDSSSSNLISDSGCSTEKVVENRPVAGSLDKRGMNEEDAAISFC
jgi:hypothetical protein